MAGLTTRCVFDHHRWHQLCLELPVGSVCCGNTVSSHEFTRWNSCFCYMSSWDSTNVGFWEPSLMVLDGSFVLEFGPLFGWGAAGQVRFRDESIWVLSISYYMLRQQVNLQQIWFLICDSELFSVLFTHIFLYSDSDPHLITNICCDNKNLSLNDQNSCDFWWLLCWCLRKANRTRTLLWHIHKTG